MQPILFRPYQAADKNQCVALFRENLSGYFSPQEIDDYRDFLSRLSDKDPYYVGVIEQQIVACGGWDKQPTGYFLRWGIVSAKHHHLGLGSQLLQFRINKVYQLHGPVDIFIKTSGKAHGFFEKFGFKVKQTIVDGIYPGIDEYRMQLNAPADPGNK